MTRRCILLFLAVAIMAVPELVSSQTCMCNNVLYGTESLFTGQSLVCGNYALIMQPDCNLVLYDSSSYIWASQTAGRGTLCRATMQANGNFVIYNGNGNSVWATGTNGLSGSYVLVLQRDRNVVVYGRASCTSRTNIPGTVGVVVASNATATAVPVKVAAAADGDLGDRKIAMVTQK